MKPKTTSRPEPPRGSEEARERRIAELTRELLEHLGEDPTREGLVRTPERVARAWLDLTAGYGQTVEGVVNGAIFEAEGSEMVIVRDIEVMSLCEHHLLPWYGSAHVAYLPRKRIIGLSKIARIADLFARRLQVQERFTTQLATAVERVLDPWGVGVVVEARHMCMMMRGVEKGQSFTTTSSLLGKFSEDPRTRAEFLSLISNRLIG
jgi:GTP cyclohydrolase I